jgi:formylglycine-generating enzyme required for sulfatase activity
LPAKLEEVLLAMLAKERGERPQTMEDVVRLLGDAIAPAPATRPAGKPVEPRPSPAARPAGAEPARRPRRRSALAALAAVLALFLVGGTALVLRRGGPPPAEPAPTPSPTASVIAQAALAPLPAAAGCPPGMALIPGGEFQMGSPAGDGDPDENPRHKVDVDPFCMDVSEVTNSEYEGFDAAHRGKRDPYSEGDRDPVIHVTWDEASRFCAAQGKRLPTEAEWEKAARGGLDGKRYPWGDQGPGQAEANFSGEAGSHKRTTPVGSHAANGYGLQDMAGNVWEWVADWYDPDYYRRSPERNPPGPPSGTARVVRGGGWNADAGILRCSNRDRGDPTGSNNALGLRCARNPP